MKIIQLLLEYDRNQTIATYGKKIEQANKNDNNKSKAEDIISRIESVDPSVNKQYVQWICKQYISGALKIEDLYKVTEPLILFQKYKKRLPLEQRDVNKLTIFDLYDIEKNITKPTLEEPTHNEAFGSDVKVWYNGPLGYLVTPLTEEASCRLGKGTKWCTAATGYDNAFNQYNQSRLFIWKDKNGQKYQFDLHSQQYMNDKDKPINYELMQQFREHPVLKELLNDDGKINQIEQAYIKERIHKSFNEANTILEAAYKLFRIASDNPYGMEMLNTLNTYLYKHLGKDKSDNIINGTRKQDRYIAREYKFLSHYFTILHSKQTISNFIERIDDVFVNNAPRLEYELKELVQHKLGADYNITYGLPEVIQLTDIITDNDDDLYQIVQHFDGLSEEHRNDLFINIHNKFSNQYPLLANLVSREMF